MKTRQWTFMEKLGWAPGPWHDEPDKMQWQDEATGLPCLIHRAPVTGALCGYVGVPEGHPWFGRDYKELEDPNVHGGLTFSDFCYPELGEHGEGICHVVEPGEDDKVWWVGFDCSHAGDLSPRVGALMRTHGALARHESLPDTYRHLAYVREECRSLAQQAAAAGA
jgi:hypothetical protein